MRTFQQILIAAVATPITQPSLEALAFIERMKQQRASTGMERGERSNDRRTTGLGFNGYYFERTAVLAYRTAYAFEDAAKQETMWQLPSEVLEEARLVAFGFLADEERSIKAGKGGLSVSGGAEREALRCFRSCLRRIANAANRELRAREEAAAKEAAAQEAEEQPEWAEVRAYFTERVGEVEAGRIVARMKDSGFNPALVAR